MEDYESSWENRFMSDAEAYRCYGKDVCGYYGGLPRKEDDLSTEMPDWMFAKEQF